MRYHWTNLRLMEDYYRQRGEFKYWQYCDISGRRKFAKQQTNRSIRAKYRDQIANEDPDEIVALNGNDYRKEWDYDWEIW